MNNNELKQIIEDLSQDVNGLKNIITRLKQKEANIQNNDFQMKDLSSANALSQQLRNTIEELGKHLIGEENHVYERL